MEVTDTTAREDLIETVVLQLIEASAAAHHDRLDAEIVERRGNTVEQDTIVRDDLLGLVELTCATLRVATTQIAGRQHGLHTHFPQHCLSGEPHLGEQALRAATREI